MSFILWSARVLSFFSVPAPVLQWLWGKGWSPAKADIPNDVHRRLGAQESRIEQGTEV